MVQLYIFCCLFKFLLIVRYRFLFCLANNTDKKDAYLIFGVSDNGEVKGVSGDENRKNQTDIVDMLRNQKFAGRVPLLVKLETILYSDK